jgi:RNA polymerase sigma factor (sigma-70 family)
LSVAQEIVHRAVSLGEKLLGDPALALTLFEEVAATVSKALTEKLPAEKASIRDMRGYLFRAYLRRINIERKVTVALNDSTQEEQEKHTRRSSESNIERQILLSEVLKSCDTLTREIFYLRLEGCSWREIGKRCGIPLNAASLRFSKALRRLRNEFRREDV